jgi:polar amino acid transport system substrate-binding protein
MSTAMTILRRYRLFAMLLGGLFLASTSSYSAEIKISLLDFCPLHCLGNDGKIDAAKPGAAAEIYQKIFGDAGIQPIFVVLPFNRGMMEVSEGRIDAISGPLQFSDDELKAKIRQLPRIGPLYARLIYPEQTIGTHQSSCFFVRSNSKWLYQGEMSLDKQRLGVANGHDYGPQMNAFLEKTIQGKNKHFVESLSGDNVFLRNLKKLVGERVDILLIDRTSGSHMIKTAEDKGEIPAGSAKLSACIGSTQNLYLSFGDQAPARAKMLARVFDKGIVHIRKSGELQRLLDKYGLDDWMDGSRN